MTFWLSSSKWFPILYLGCSVLITSPSDLVNLSFLDGRTPNIVVLLLIPLLLICSDEKCHIVLQLDAQFEEHS